MLHGIFVILTFPLPDRPKTVPLIVIIFTLSKLPDNFTHQWRASGWERVNIIIAS